MINTIELYNLIARRYLTCYKEYLDEETRLDFKYKLLYRLNVYDEILEVIYDRINE